MPKAHSCGALAGESGKARPTLARVRSWAPPPFLVACVLGFAATWRLQFERGTIGLFHDWSIFPYGPQNAAYAHQLFDGWFAWTLGEPVTFPTEYPLRFLLGALGAAGASGDLLSHVFVFCIPALSFLCAFTLARYLTGSYSAALAGGFFYALNPVVLNKLVSGQETYVVGYALLPLVLWSYGRAVEVRRYAVRAVGFGAVLALVGVQIQLGLLAFFIAVLDAAFRHRSVRLARRFAVLAIGAATALVIHAPTVVGVSGGTRGFADRAQFSGVSAYLGMNSIAPLDAVRLLGYLTHYAEQAIAQWSVEWNLAMVIIILAAVIGVATAKGNFRTFAIVAFGLVLALVTGTHSIFGAQISWLFGHVRYMEVFRELYHLMALPALIYSCGVAFFYRFCSTLRRRRALLVTTWCALLMVGLPMLTGDANGWMRAFPIGQTYADALRAQNSGQTRVLWLPMDQPLSFRGYGAGVDPMSVTSRGSLWDYSLNWPLTAVDTQVRYGDRALRASLRALGVGDVVKRLGMQSQLARFTSDPIDANRVFSRPIKIPLSASIRYSNSIDYRIRSPRAMLSRVRGIAIVPQRLRVCAAAVNDDYAPVAFAQARSVSKPYVVFFDPGDASEESMEAGGPVGAPPITSIDARDGFASAAGWWWYRPSYADVPGAAIALGRQRATIRAPRRFRDATIVLAWIATPVGSSVRVVAGKRAFVLDTRGAGQWRSAALRLGPIAARQPIRIESLDPDGEVALRNVSMVEYSEYLRRRLRWRRLKASAIAAVPIVDKTTLAAARSGTGPVLGVLEAGRRYRIKVVDPRGEIRVNDSSGFLLALIDAKHPSADFLGTGLNAVLDGVPRDVTWKIGLLSKKLSLPRPSRAEPGIIMFNTAYSPHWQLSNATAHFASALGTNIFETNSTGEGRISYGLSWWFHVAYIIGSLTLLGAILLNLAAGLAERQSSIKNRVDADRAGEVVPEVAP